VRSRLHAERSPRGEARHRPFEFFRVRRHQRNADIQAFELKTAADSTPNVWVNGEQAGLDPRDRGLAYGDGLFETMACRNGRLPWLTYHLDRLAHGCARLAIPLPDTQALTREIESRCAGVDSAVVKLILTRGVGARGYRAPEPATVNRILSVTPWSGYPGEQYTLGVEMRVCALRLGENPQLAGLKHLCRLEQVLAQMELVGDTADEGLLCDRSGYVVGGISTNVFALQGRRLTTPRLTRCGVHGVMRRIVLEQAGRAGLESEQRDLRLDELYESDEIFVTNAVAGIRPVRLLGHRRFEPGPHTRALMALLNEAEQGGSGSKTRLRGKASSNGKGSARGKGIASGKASSAGKTRSGGKASSSVSRNRNRGRDGA
jgi:4-amino-4-deoxychorismate lyase